MKKKLYVASAVQAALLKKVLIPHMATGFWKEHRPADHATQWEDVEIIVTENAKLGAVDFVVPRLYNFVNPEFIKPNEDILVEAAQSAKAGSNFRSVKKELIELSRIVGGRLTDKNSIPTKANRGNNKSGTVQETVTKAKTAVKKAATSVKKTVTKSKEPGTVTTQKTGDTTVRRAAVTRAKPEPEVEAAAAAPTATEQPAE
jgi:cytoskeletal protein RodZ